LNANIVKFYDKFQQLKQYQEIVPTRSKRKKFRMAMMLEWKKLKEWKQITYFGGIKIKILLQYIHNIFKQFQSYIDSRNPQ
jgi:hypothetical protein